MKQTNKGMGWSLPIAGIVVAPLAAIPEEAVCAIAVAIKWIANENITALLAATNALTLVP